MKDNWRTLGPYVTAARMVRDSEGKALYLQTVAVDGDGDALVVNMAQEIARGVVGDQAAMIDDGNAVA